MKMSDDSNKQGRSYFFPEGISAELCQLTGDKKPEKERAEVHKQLIDYIKSYRKDFLGYQSTAMLNTQDLAPFIESAVNNIGDSFANPEMTDPELSPDSRQLADGYFSLNAKWIERAVLDYFAERWHAGAPRRVQEDGPGDDWKKTYWGYVLSMGATEGNLMALRSARDYLKGRELRFEPGKPPGESVYYQDCDEKTDSKLNPVLLYSNASHYSVHKLAQMLEFESRIIDTDRYGQMDLGDLVKKAERILIFEKRHLAVLFNYGTTWTGALDDVENAVKKLMPLIDRAQMNTRTVYHDGKPCVRRGFWFHVDAALGAGYATYVDRDGEFELPSFDFRNDIQSISMSGHKWPGAPWPTGIYMTQNQYMLTNETPAYVGSLDSTLAGSRNGIAPIFLWDWLARSSDQARKEEAIRQLKLARDALGLIKTWDPDAWRAPGSLMVVFKRPSDKLVRKYALASNGKFVHLVCMRHVEEDMIGRLVSDLLVEGNEDVSVQHGQDAREAW